MRYLLDTDTCIYVINEKPPSVVRRIRAHRPEDVSISTVTIAELEYGVARSSYPDRNRVALMLFLSPFSIAGFDPDAAAQYGLIRSALESAGVPIGPLDTLLAAQARAMGAVLVTNNEREFRRVEGLKVENWAA
jgi:tRNA(fMet)-specific endonuclease VapC